MHLPQPNDKSFELPPSGTHLATCYRVIDLGTQVTNWQGQSKRQHKVLISWELPDERMSDGRPFSISQRYTWSMSDKAKLRKDLESWRGVPFTERDFGSQGFDIRNIVGKACLLTIMQETNGEKTYANIASISKLMKGQQAPTETVNEKAYLWINSERWDSDVFHKLSDSMKSTIMTSPEYREMMNGHDDPSPPIADADANDFHSDPIPF
jgi:hypothetical protein